MIKDSKMIDNLLFIRLRAVCKFILIVFIIPAIFLPCTGIKGLLNFLCLGMLYIGLSILWGLFAWQIKNDLNIKNYEKEKKRFAAFILTIAMVVFLFMGLHYSLNSILDLMSRKTNDVLLVESSIKTVHHRKRAATYEINGEDINHNEYSFDIEKSDYRSIEGAKYLGQANNKVKVTYYAHTKVVKSYMMENRLEL